MLSLLLDPLNNSDHPITHEVMADSIEVEVVVGSEVTIIPITILILLVLPLVLSKLANSVGSMAMLLFLAGIGMMQTSFLRL